MKLSFYIAVIIGVLCLGMALASFRDSGVIPVTSHASEGDYPQPFQEKAALFAGNAKVKPIDRWEISSGESDSLLVYALDSQGQQIFTVVFSKLTGHPRTIAYQKRTDTPLPEYRGKGPREIAQLWLKRIGLAGDLRWQWVRDGKSGASRYVSSWRNSAYDVTLSINASTGHFIAMRITENSEAAEPSPVPLAQTAIQ